MVRRLSHVAPVLLVVACATGRAEPAAPDPMSRGLVALAGERWSAAEEALHEVAERCESGSAGPDALLLLATVALDPGNPARDAGRAARYAAHVIALPGVDAVTLELAEGLYLAAVDGGAEALDDGPGVEVRPLWPSLAARFSSCDEAAAAPVADRSPPRYPGTPLALQLSAAITRADSLGAVLDSVAAVTERVVVVREAQPASGDVDSATRLAERVRALEAELKRIRTLLRKGGGAGGP